MKDVGIVYGNAEAAKPLIVGLTTVYVHEDIEKVEQDVEGNEVDDLFRYHEYQYSVQEYIKLQSDRSDEIEDTMDDLLTNVLPELLGGE